MAIITSLEEKRYPKKEPNTKLVDHDSVWASPTMFAPGDLKRPIWSVQCIPMGIITEPLSSSGIHYFKPASAIVQVVDKVIIV